MQLRDIAINNLRRRMGKAAFLLCGMAFAIATIVSLYSITSAMDDGMAKKFEQLGAKVIITPTTNSVALSYGGITIPSKVSYDVKDLEMAALDKIEAINKKEGIKGQIKNISPKVLGKATVEDKQVLTVGVDFDRELESRPYWEINGQKPETENEALLGAAAAAKLKLSTGDSFDLTGLDGSPGKFTVSGILGETGSEEDGLVFIGLTAAQSFLGKEGKLSFIELSVEKNEAALSAVVQELNKALPDTKIKTVKEAVEARKEIIDRFSKFSLVVSIIMLLIGTLMVVTTMLSAVNERTREIGIFRAIGFRKSHIIKVILLEAGIVSGLSGLTGYIVGIAAAVVLAPRIAEMETVVSWNPLLGVLVLLASIGVGVLASLYPANKAAKLDPAEALRFM